MKGWRERKRWRIGDKPWTDKTDVHKLRHQDRIHFSESLQ